MTKNCADKARSWAKEGNVRMCLMNLNTAIAHSQVTPRQVKNIYNTLKDNQQAGTTYFPWENEECAPYTKKEALNS